MGVEQISPWVHEPYVGLKQPPAPKLPFLQTARPEQLCAKASGVDPNKTRIASPTTRRALLINRMNRPPG
jgi:hypothetical protein